MCQGRPADPTDPGDAADLSIMGYLRSYAAVYPRARIALVLALHICATTYENQQFLNQGSGIAWIKVNY